MIDILAPSSCEAKRFMAELAGARGEQDKSKALLEALRGECARAPAKAN